MKLRKKTLKVQISYEYGKNERERIKRMKWNNMKTKKVMQFFPKRTQKRMPQIADNEQRKKEADYRRSFEEKMVL